MTSQFTQLYSIDVLIAGTLKLSQSNWSSTGLKVKSACIFRLCIFNSENSWMIAKWVVRQSIVFTF